MTAMGMCVMYISASSVFITLLLATDKVLHMRCTCTYCTLQISAWLLKKKSRIQICFVKGIYDAGKLYLRIQVY